MRFIFCVIFCFANLFSSAQSSYNELIKYGEELVEQNKLDSGERIFYKALSVQEGAEAYYGLGYILSVKCHDFGISCDDAIRYLLKSKELDSSYRRQDYNLAVCYIKKDDFKTALHYLNLAIAKNENDLDYYANRAIVRQKLGDEKGYKKDRKVYEKMLRKKK